MNSAQLSSYPHIRPPVGPTSPINRLSTTEIDAERYKAPPASIKIGFGAEDRRYGGDELERHLPSDSTDVDEFNNPTSSRPRL